MLGTVREIAPNFVLGERHGRGAGPEREGRLLRPRGSYNSALWRQVAPDTVELVWTTARSDSTRWEPGIVYSDALRARVGLAGDTLRGVARWRTDYSPADSFSFRAVRTTCGADVPR